MQQLPPYKIDSSLERKKNFLHHIRQCFQCIQHYKCKLLCKNRNQVASESPKSTPTHCSPPDQKESEKKTMESESMSKRTMPSWRAPMFPGLHNSPRIIPEYYTSTHLKNGILKINYYDMMIDDIRNLRPLSIDQLQYIKKRRLTPQEYYHLICEYNQVVCALIETL